MFEAIKNHWTEYLIEAWCLATFMVSACFFNMICERMAQKCSLLKMLMSKAVIDLHKLSNHVLWMTA